MFPFSNSAARRNMGAGKMGVGMKSSLRGTLLAGVSSVALVFAANAADLQVKAPAPALPMSNWEGFYIGVHGGAGRLNASQHHFNEDGVCFEASTCVLNASGAVFGAQVGYNWQSRYTVYGIEADWSHTSFDNTQTLNALTAAVIESKVSWLASVRGRMGLAIEDTMIYVTGGVAFGGTRSGWAGGYNSTNTVCCDLQSGTRTGWVAGVGAEHMVMKNWTVRAEGLYYDLGRQQQTFAVAGSVNGYKTEFSHEVMVARVGLNYKW
jgi:outer membrane immunogenic protein